MEACGKYFYIRSRLNGMVLDIKDGTPDPGTEIIMWEKKDEDCDNQLWFEDRVAGVIRSKMNKDLVLQYDDGRLIINWFDKNCDDQKLICARDRIQSRSNPMSVLDIRDANAECGASLCLYDNHEDKNQLWHFEHVPGHYFMIKSRLNGKVLDLLDSNTDEGAPIGIWEENGGDNQLWFENSDGLIRHKLNGFVIDASEKLQLRMARFDPSNENQGWIYSEGSAIRNMNNHKRVIDIYQALEDDGTPVIDDKYHGGDNQQWDLVYL